MNDKKICITFAGAVGSSKTPITNYLSTKLLLPVFNNDAVHSEIIEDFGVFVDDEYAKRRNARLEEIVKNGHSFICDASVDREWKDVKKQLIAHSYDFFIISIDLSKDLLTKLYKAKKYFESLERIDELIQDHNNFLSQHSDDVNIHITDKDFINRIQISYNEVSKYLEEKNQDK
jgi:hypothetical protein